MSKPDRRELFNKWKEVHQDSWTRARGLIEKHSQIQSKYLEISVIVIGFSFMVNLISNSFYNLLFPNFTQVDLAIVFFGSLAILFTTYLISKIIKGNISPVIIIPFDLSLRKLQFLDNHSKFIDYLKNNEVDDITKFANGFFNSFKGLLKTRQRVDEIKLIERTNEKFIDRKFSKLYSSIQIDINDFFKKDLGMGLLVTVRGIFNILIINEDPPQYRFPIRDIEVIFELSIRKPESRDAYIVLNMVESQLYEDIFQSGLYALETNMRKMIEEQL